MVTRQSSYNYEEILNKYKIFVYPRLLSFHQFSKEKETTSDIEQSLYAHTNVVFMNDAPGMKISSSFIRDAIKKGNDVRYLLTESVFKYIDEMNFYR